MNKYFHGHLFSGTEIQGHLYFGCRAIAKFQPKACSLEAVHSVKTTPRLESLSHFKINVSIPSNLNCGIKPVNSQPRKGVGLSYSNVHNVVFSRSVSLQSQAHKAVVHPRSKRHVKRPVLKDIDHLDELLSALAPFARCSDPFEGSFRGIEACMAMNHLHRLRFQCQVLVDAHGHLQQARSQQQPST
jgi:hypothetical protein